MTAASLCRSAFGLACIGMLVLSLLPPTFLPPVFHWWDKAQHAFAFAVLTLLARQGWPALEVRACAGLLLYGAGIEVAQGLTGWRSAEFSDLVADGVGVFIGALAYRGFARMMRWRCLPVQAPLGKSQNPRDE